MGQYLELCADNLGSLWNLDISKQHAGHVIWRPCKRVQTHFQIISIQIIKLVAGSISIIFARENLASTNLCIRAHSETPDIILVNPVAVKLIDTPIVCRSCGKDTRNVGIWLQDNTIYSVDHIINIFTEVNRV